MTKLYVDLLQAFDEMGEQINNDELRSTVQEMLRKISCCFTGHRPEKCKRTENEIKADLETAIRKAIADGYQVFINGAQRGVDLWAAEVVMKLKDEGTEIELVTAIPFEGFEKRWETDWINRLGTVIECSDDVHTVSTSRGADGFSLRDQWMVDHSSRVIAVYNGTPGGTKTTIDYAKQQRREVQILEG